MKNIRFVLAFAFALALSFCASAQSLPIGSEDSLRNYALGKVTRGYRWVNSQSIGTVGGSPLYAAVEGTGAEDVLNKLLGTEIMYTIQNPGDLITSHVHLYDERGNTLFYGSAEYGIGEAGGKGGGPSYVLWMQNIALGENVSFAKVLVFDEKGHTKHTIQLEVENGRVMFPPYLAGAPNGILVVRTKDGNVLTYKLKDPKAANPAFAIDRGADYQIPGHHVYRETRDETIYLDFVEVHYLPTVYLEFRKGQRVIVDVQGLLQKNGGTFMERPSGLYYTSPEGDGYIALNLNSATVIDLPGDGSCRLRFVWTDFGQPQNIYIPTPEDGIGKGSTTTTM